MTITINNHELPDLTHDVYDVTFFDEEILTLVTDAPSYIDSWISETKRLFRNRFYCQDCIDSGCFRGLMVGLDIEWRPNQTPKSQNPVATLQLCVDRRCLIIKLIHSPFIPQSLINFLGNPDYKFVGVGIENDAKKLKEDYDLTVANAIDLRDLAVDTKEFKKAGLRVLAKCFLEKDVEKPKAITTSGWDVKWLSSAQVQYACVDAHLSYKIGSILINGNCNLTCINRYE